MSFYDALKPEQKQYLDKSNDVWFYMGQPLLPLTPEQQLISKTEANFFSFK